MLSKLKDWLWFAGCCAAFCVLVLVAWRYLDERGDVSLMSWKLWAKWTMTCAGAEIYALRSYKEQNK